MSPWQKTLMNIRKSLLPPMFWQDSPADQTSMANSPWLNPASATASAGKTTTNVAYTNHQEFYISGSNDPGAVGNAVVDKTAAAQTRMTQGVVMAG
jgi:hypothetical protein